jgi:hypothetical protein
VPINPLYAEALARANGEKTGGSDKDYPRHPNFKFKDIGDKVDGTVAKVGKPFVKTNDWQGEKREVTVQVIELDNATVTRFQEDEDTPPVIETYPKLNIWLQKNGHYAAIGAELMRLDLSDIPDGARLAFKWSGLGTAVGDGARPHKFVARIAPKSE